MIGSRGLLPALTDSWCWFGLRGVAWRSCMRYEKEDRMNFTMTKLRTLAVCGMVLFAGEDATGEIITNLPQALKTAGEQDKPIFIYLFDSF